MTEAKFKKLKVGTKVRLIVDPEELNIHQCTCLEIGSIITLNSTAIHGSDDVWYRKIDFLPEATCIYRNFYVVPYFAVEEVK